MGCCGTRFRENYGTKCSKIRVWAAVVQGSVEIIVLSVAKFESGMLQN